MDLSILIIDDEPQALKTFELLLYSNGIKNTISCSDSRKVMDLLSQHAISLVLLDLQMPYISGEELLPQITRKHPDIPVIIITASEEIDTAVHCMKIGAFDYLVKPVEQSQFITSIRHALERRELIMENRALKECVLNKSLKNPKAFSNIITNDTEMFSIFQYVEAIAPTSRPILITGETGVGKELVARAIHDLSGRKGRFVAVNVAGLDDETFTDTIFGHRKGAFTGALASRAGLIKEAANGTLFLDEIGDLKPASQIKLLRFLQENEFYPIGSDSPQHAYSRILAATNAELKEITESGRFRRDLYYRISTHHIHIPPLRKRIHDLPLLLHHFSDQAATSIGIATPQVLNKTYEILSGYSYPGNIRELEAIIFDAVTRNSPTVLTPAHFADYTGKKDKGNRPVFQPREKKQVLFEDKPVLPTLSEASQYLIKEALKRSNGNQTKAAKLLGISQPSLSKRLSRLGKKGKHYNL